MKDLRNYKKRFYNLMESTMGDVKPLITEQINCGDPATFFKTKPNDLDSFLSDIKSCKSARFCPPPLEKQEHTGDPNLDLATKYWKSPTPDKMWGCVQSMIYDYGQGNTIEDEGMEIFNHMIEHYGGTWRIAKIDGNFKIA